MHICLQPADDPSYISAQLFNSRVPFRLFLWQLQLTAQDPAHSIQHSLTITATYMYSIYITAQHTGPDQTSSQHSTASSPQLQHNSTTRH